jgi:Flp pilus assembly protein TadG
MGTQGMDQQNEHKNCDSQKIARKPALRWVRRFAGNRKGVVAIEFAALAIPFSLLVFAILESCISFAAQQVLSNTTEDIARKLRTGQILPSDVTETALKGWICNDLDIIVSSGCPGLEVDLQEYSTFADAAAVRIKYTSDNDIDTSGFAVSPGGSGTKNQLRVFYRWPVITDFMRKYMSNLKDGKTLLFATVTWQNEPY